MEDLIALGVTVLLLVIALLAGTIEQRSHYRSIRQREAQYRDILVFNEKRPPAGFAGQGFALVCGSVVMGSDYFRQFAASLKFFFGGRLGSFEAMLDRGRREAILRMKEEARRVGAKAIFNVRLETSALETKKGRQGLACVELVAYGTALGAAGTKVRHDG